VIEKVTSFLLDHAFKIMIAGFAFSAAGMIMVIQAQHKNPVLGKIGFGIAATGLGLYVIGRIGVIGAQRRAKKLREQSLEDATEEKKE
jgi:hypothetical protein